MKDKMILEPMPAVRVRVARELKKEEDRVMAWMRRNTPLTDEQIREALTDYSTAAFNAGHEIGFIEALYKAQWSATRNRTLSWVTFVATAALVAAIWMLLQR